MTYMKYCSCLYFVTVHYQSRCFREKTRPEYIVHNFKNSNTSL